MIVKYDDCEFENENPKSALFLSFYLLFHSRILSFPCLLFALFFLIFLVSNSAWKTGYFVLFLLSKVILTSNIIKNKKSFPFHIGSQLETLLLDLSSFFCFNRIWTYENSLWKPTLWLTPPLVSISLGWSLFLEGSGTGKSWERIRDRKKQKILAWF